MSKFQLIFRRSICKVFGHQSSKLLGTEALYCVCCGRFQVDNVVYPKWE